MGRLNQNTVFTVLFVCLAVVGVAMVASTITSVQAVDNVIIDPGGPSDDPGGDTDAFVPDDTPTPGEGDNGVDDPMEGMDLVFCIEFLQTWPAILGILAGMFTILYLVYLRFDVASAGLFATFLIPVTMLAYFLLTNCPGGGFDQGNGGVPDVNPVSNGGTELPVPESPIIVALVFGGIILLAVAMLVTMTREDEHVEPLEEEEIPEADAADFARAAGEAADRIEETNVPVDNAVYRAWVQMTGLLHIDNPETAAPRTFAEAAIDIGLADDDVWELTELFNEVRYGGKDADTREERALEILRNIEETYQEDSTDTGADSSGETPDDADRTEESG